MGKCGRDPEEHCCWLQGIPCPFLRRADKKLQKEQGYHWRCQLRYELGSWDAVHEDARYRKTVKPVWMIYGIGDCGDWPQNSRNPCSICGEK